jgi:hypothetical protein
MNPLSLSKDSWMYDRSSPFVPALLRQAECALAAPLRWTGPSLNREHAEPKLLVGTI